MRSRLRSASPRCTSLDCEVRSCTVIWMVMIILVLALGGILGLALVAQVGARTSRR
jgi:hypothetical protein